MPLQTSSTLSKNPKWKSRTSKRRRPVGVEFFDSIARDLVFGSHVDPQGSAPESLVDSVWTGGITVTGPWYGLLDTEFPRRFLERSVQPQLAFKTQTVRTAGRSRPSTALAPPIVV